MPPVVIAAGIGAAGSLAGGVISSSSASKARKAQQSAAAQQIAANKATEDRIVGLSQPAIDRGNAAGDLYGNFLGLGGGDKAAAALATYRGSTGYQDLLNTGLGAVNAKAYAKGMGASGATLKALQSRGMALADQNSAGWLNGLNNLNSLGTAAIGNVSGAAQNINMQNNQATQNAADASSNASLASGAGWTSALQGIGNAAAYAIGNRGGTSSSYGQASVAPGYAPYANNGGFLSRTLR